MIFSGLKDMWISVPFTVLVIHNFILCSGQLEEPNWPTALIHHPQAALEYFLATHEYPKCECLTEFINAGKECRKTACLYYLGESTSFSPKPDDTSYVTKDFEEGVEKLYTENKRPVFVEDFKFKAHDARYGETKELETPAQMCVEEKDKDHWALTVGYHEGVSIVFRKNFDSKEFELFGLLEEMPKINAAWTRKQLESLFTEGRADPKAPVLKEKNVRSLCELNDHELFRLCSVGFLAIKSTKDEPHDQGNFIDPILDEKEKCIRSGIKINEEIKPIEIIPCAVNTDASTPNLFLTKDPFSPYAAFTVNKKDGQWRLGTRMYNVRVLKPFANRESQNISSSKD